MVKEENHQRSSLFRKMVKCIIFIIVRRGIIVEEVMKEYLENVHNFLEGMQMAKNVPYLLDIGQLNGIMEMVKIQNVFEKTLEAKELSKVQIGGAFSAIKTFEVLNAAADNQSDGGGGVGGFLGAGIGIGAGLPLGSQMGQKLDITGNQNKENKTEPSDRIKKLKDMLDQGLITEDQFNQKREEILKDL